jgi:hypothetical protein
MKRWAILALLVLSVPMLGAEPSITIPIVSQWNAQTLVDVNCTDSFDTASLLGSALVQVSGSADTKCDQDSRATRGASVTADIRKGPFTIRRGQIGIKIIANVTNVGSGGMAFCIEFERPEEPGTFKARCFAALGATGDKFYFYGALIPTDGVYDQSFGDVLPPEYYVTWDHLGGTAQAGSLSIVPVYRLE